MTLLVYRKSTSGINRKSNLEFSENGSGFPRKKEPAPKEMEGGKRVGYDDKNESRGRHARSAVNE